MGLVRTTWGWAVAKWSEVHRLDSDDVVSLIWANRTAELQTMIADGVDLRHRARETLGDVYSFMSTMCRRSGRASTMQHTCRGVCTRLSTSARL